MQWIKGWFIIKGTTFYGFNNKEVLKIYFIIHFNHNILYGILLLLLLLVNKGSAYDHLIWFYCIYC